MPTTGRKSKGGQAAEAEEEDATNGNRNGNPQDSLTSQERRTRLTGKRNLGATGANGAVDIQAEAEDKATGPGSPRPKKPKSSKPSFREDEADDEAAVYLAPLDEAGDAVEALPSLAAVDGESAASEEEDYLDRCKYSGWGSIVTDDTDADHDFEVWRRAIQELRRQRKPQARRGGAGERPTAEELHRHLREALQSKDWSAITAPMAMPRSSEISAAVRQLSREDVLATLVMIADRHESHPRERNVCAAWIQQILDHRAESLTGRREFKSALRPFLSSLEARLDSPFSVGQVLTCMGKWRMAAGLARSRLQEQLRASTGTALNEVEDEEDFGEDEEEEKDECEDDAEEAGRSNALKSAADDSDDGDDE